MRVLLHGARLALHVHQAHRGLTVRHCFERTRLAQRVDIVDHRRPGRNRAAHHFRFAGVDRYRYREPAKFFQHGHYPPQFFVEAYRLGTRTRGFSADVENVGTFLDQDPRVFHGLPRVEEASAVGKRIRGDVHHPHDQRAFQRQRETAKLQNGVRSEG